jgi:hypothetical protein
MKEILEKILIYLPKYLSDFGSILVGPKTFIAGRVAKDEAFSDAMLFLGVSIALSIVMTASSPEKEFWTYVGTNSVVTLLAMCSFGTITRFAWWIVGGKAPAQSFFATYAFFFGVGLILKSLVLLLSLGFLKLLEPERYKQFFAALSAGFQALLLGQQFPPPNVTMPESWVFPVALAIFEMGVLTIGFWSFIAWGAYRQMNGLSRLRSFWALSIVGVLLVPATAIIYLIQRGMS